MDRCDTIYSLNNLHSKRKPTPSSYTITLSPDSAMMKVNNLLGDTKADARALSGALSHARIVTGIK